jgi:hypothetical protein
MRRDVKIVYKILVGKSEGRKLLEIPMPRSKVVAKMDLKYVGFEGVDWIQLAEEKNFEPWRYLSIQHLCDYLSKLH